MDRAPDSRQSRKLSTVPKQSSPASARSRSPGVASRICATFGPEKYASTGRPVSARIRSSCPAARSASHAGAVIRLCQTIAGATGGSGRAVPDDRRLALVRDPDRRDPRHPAGRGLDRGPRDGDLALPDVLRVVGHVTRGRERLQELLLSARDDRSGAVDDERARRRRALVEREDQVLCRHRAATGSGDGPADAPDLPRASRLADDPGRRSAATPTRGTRRPRHAAGRRPSRAPRRAAPRPAARSRPRGPAAPSQGASDAPGRRRARAPAPRGQPT